jgi:hypothetical protein
MRTAHQKESRPEEAGQRMSKAFGSDTRAVTPVVAKTLEVAIVVLFVGVVTTGLYTGVVPEYRDSAGERIGDRTLATAGDWVEDAVPPTATRVDRQVRVDLPETIRGAGYWIRADGRTLVLDHPRERIGNRLRLNLPSSVVSVTGRWSSYEPAIVTVQGSSDGLTVRLVRG